MENSLQPEDARQIVEEIQRVIEACIRVSTEASGAADKQLNDAKYMLRRKLTDKFGPVGKTLFLNEAHETHEPKTKAKRKSSARKT